MRAARLTLSQQQASQIGMHDTRSSLCPHSMAARQPAQGQAFKMHPAFKVVFGGSQGFQHLQNLIIHINITPSTQHRYCYGTLQPNMQVRDRHRVQPKQALHNGHMLQRTPQDWAASSMVPYCHNDAIAMHAGC